MRRARQKRVLHAQTMYGRSSAGIQDSGRLELDQGSFRRDIVEIDRHGHVDSHSFRGRDDVGGNPWSFVELDDGQHVRAIAERTRRGAPYYRVAVHFSAPAHRPPFQVLRKTSWASITGIVNKCL